MQTLKPTLSPLVIREQGSFAAGGTVKRTPGTYDSVTRGPAGQSLHGDHAYVFYQIPAAARKLPLVFQHGHLQHAKTWETTPDGREGFQNIFLRRDWSVYLLDGPRRGRGGSTEPITNPATPEDQIWFETFRVGHWPGFFPGVQFPQDAETLNQYFRQSVPYSGPFDLGVAGSALAAVFDRTGPGIAVTHSQGGGIGWDARLKSDNIRAIVCYEPGSNFPFPEGEVPPTLPSAAGPLEPLSVPLAEFRKLTTIPIVIYYGDFIPEEPVPYPGQDGWRVRLEMARLWTDTVNRHGGDATLVHLPAIGIPGNTHFPFSDLNNLQIADLMSDWLEAKGLAGTED